MSIDATSPKLTDESPVQTWLYPSRESLLESVTLTSIDFVSAYQALLGYELVDECAGTDSPLDNQANGKGFLALSTRVLVTLGGLVGDCGWGSPSKFLFMDRHSMGRLTRSNDSYLKGILTREMAQVSSGYYITRSADDMMTTAFACHGSVMYPPFFPMGRGEDMLFARLVKRTVRSACFGHVPYAIYHSPLETRRFWPGEILRSAASIDLSSFLSCLISIDFEEDGDDYDVLEKVGFALSHSGTVSCTEFREKAQECRHLLTEERRRRLENQLSLSCSIAPSYVADLNAYMNRQLEAQSRPEGTIPVELLYRNDEETALRVTQQLVSLYGQLFLAWPSMICASSFLEELRPKRG